MSPVSVFGSRLVVCRQSEPQTNWHPRTEGFKRIFNSTNLRDLSFADVLSLKRIVMLSLVAFRDLAVFHK